MRIEGAGPGSTAACDSLPVGGTGNRALTRAPGTFIRLKPKGPDVEIARERGRHLLIVDAGSRPPSALTLAVSPWDTRVTGDPGKAAGGESAL